MCPNPENQIDFLITGLKQCVTDTVKGVEVESCHSEWPILLKKFLRKHVVITRVWEHPVLPCKGPWHDHSWLDHPQPKNFSGDAYENMLLYYFHA